MNQATRETTPFHIFKSLVATEAGLSVAELHAERLHAAYDMGEPVWMVVDEMRLRAQKPCKLPNINSAVCVRRVKA